MRIKHITLMAGPSGTFPIGHERDVSAEEGGTLIAGNYAIEIKPRVPETATARPGGTATAAEQEAAKNLAAIGKAVSAGKRSGKRNVTPPPVGSSVALVEVAPAESAGNTSVETPEASEPPPAAE